MLTVTGLLLDDISPLVIPGHLPFTCRPKAIFLDASCDHIVAIRPYGLFDAGGRGNLPKALYVSD